MSTQFCRLSLLLRTKFSPTDESFRDMHFCTQSCVIFLCGLNSSWIWGQVLACHLFAFTLTQPLFRNSFSALLNIFFTQIFFIVSTYFYRLSEVFQTADENYNALKDFFSIYPQYLHKEFFVTGESYAGVYVPTLARRILQGMYSQELPVNFKVRSLFRVSSCM